MRGLLITYFFPPLNSIASHRLYSFATYLNTQDFKLDVLCPQWDGSLNLDASAFTVFNTEKQHFDHNFGEVKRSGLRKVKGLIANKIFKLNLIRSSNPGNFYKQAIEKISQLDMKNYDFIITSYAPLDTIHVGHYIKSKFPNIKWIIDYRDLYSQLEYANYSYLGWFFKKFEQKITKKADGFITVSKILKEKQEKLLSKKGEIIYNGYDNYGISPDIETENELKRIGMPVMSHVGSLYKGERDVKPFLRYMKNSGLDQKFCCLFALINDFDQEYLESAIKEIGLNNVIIKRNLSFQQSLTIQNYSDFLLLFSNFGGRGNGYLTGKVFEYIATKKTIVYSGTTTRGYELFDLIIDNELGDSFEKIDFFQPQKYSKRDYSFFSRDAQAKRLEEYILNLLKR